MLLPEAVVNEVLPRRVQVSNADLGELCLELVDEALDRVEQERVQISTGPTRVVEVAVVGRPRPVVVVRKQVRRRRRDSGCGEDAELDQTRRAAIAIAEWVVASMSR